jgi:beta-glucanase (GH16 family)
LQKGEVMSALRSSHSCFSVFIFPPTFFCVALLLLTSRAALAQPVVFNFDNGQLPAGTTFTGNQAGTGLTNAGGFANSGCLVLTRPGTGATNYGQWIITNDLASGVAVTSFSVSFKLYMGHGSGGNGVVPNSGGNGVVFHLGPVPASQYTGSASSWGNGLDVTFRTYNSTPPAGVDVEYNPVGENFKPGNGASIAVNSFVGFFQTNGALDSFSEAVNVSLGLTNGALTVVCSNASIGNVVVYRNLSIAGFTNISPGCIAFTATEGAGAHEDAWLDNISIDLNCYQTTGAVIFTTQPANQIAHANEAADFTVAVTGASPFTYQWSSNGVPIPGATAASYTTPPVEAGMSGAVYSVSVSNSVGAVTSGNAALRVLPVLPRALVWGDEFNGTVVDTTKWARQGDWIRVSGTSPFLPPPGWWMKEDAYLNGQGQLVLRAMQDSVTGNYGSGAVYGQYKRTFGYFEAKVKFPTQQGHWCAFWVYSDSEGSTNIIGGADGAEIDIMEKAWLTDRVQSALHWDGYGANSGSAGQSTYNMGMTDGGWHIFGLDWTPTNYAFYVDGKLTYSTNAGGVSQVPSYVILSDEVGYMGNGPTVWGNGSITNATLPDYYLIDYVHVYDTNVLAPPVIVMQPQSANVPAGAVVSFTVMLTNNAITPLSYQWWRVTPGGATNVVAMTSGALLTDTFTTPPLWGADSGSHYYVVVSNALSVVTSGVVTVIVPRALLSSPATRDGTNLVLSWSGGGILQSATNLAGPWMAETNATSPFTNSLTPNCPQKFFHVQQ